MLISVIIPTYNRPQSVLRTLASLDQQTLARDAYEVVVVDDGSTYESTEITNKQFSFTFSFLRKDNQGATIARNYGVQHSQGDILVFMDDDVTISPETLSALAEAHRQYKQSVVVGTLLSRSSVKTPFYKITALEAALNGSFTSPLADRCIHFTHCNTQLLAVKREDFFELGMIQDPTGGWPNWDDVDFGYRAHLAGFQLLQSGTAVGEHWDYALADLDTSCQRWYKAGKSAAKLFQVHPDLSPHLPMFHDKLPITWQRDSAKLILRKLIRPLSSAKVILNSMAALVCLLEKYYSSPLFLRPLYRWMIGGYLFRGYRAGLREL